MRAAAPGGRHLPSAVSTSRTRQIAAFAEAHDAMPTDVSDVEGARGMGRTLDTRPSRQVRGRIVHRMRPLAAETGVAVVSVPARGTSAHCPRCSPLRGTARPPTGPPCPAGHEPGARIPAVPGRATVTRVPGSASRPAASLTGPVR